MKRPVAITALSVLSFAGTLLAGVSALSLLFPARSFALMWRLNPRAHQSFMAMGGWAVLLLAVVSVACGVTAVGLWRQRRWGYAFAVGGLSIHLVADVLNVLLGIEPRAILGIPIVAALLLYLSRPRVRAAFAGEAGHEHA